MAAIDRGVSPHLSTNTEAWKLVLDRVLPKELATFMQVNRAAVVLVREVCRTQTLRAFEAVKVPSSTGKEESLLDRLGIKELLTHAPAVIQPPPITALHTPAGSRYQDFRWPIGDSVLMTPHLRSFGAALIVSVLTPRPDPSGTSLTAFILGTEHLRISFKSPEGDGIVTHRNDTYAKMHYCADLIRGIPRGIFRGAEKDEDLWEGARLEGRIALLDRPRAQRPALPAPAAPPSKKI